MKVKRLPWRTIFYLLVTTWLLLDLKYCNGPLKRKIAASRPSADALRVSARQNSWVALVNQEPVTKNQLDLAVARERIIAGEDFATVAAEMSEDERTKGHGGDLNWFNSLKPLPRPFLARKSAN